MSTPKKCTSHCYKYFTLFISHNVSLQKLHRTVLIWINLEQSFERYNAIYLTWVSVLLELSQVQIVRIESSDISFYSVFQGLQYRYTFVCTVALTKNQQKPFCFLSQTTICNFLFVFLSQTTFLFVAKLGLSVSFSGFLCGYSRLR